jgi:DNA (cytosine-5)-methyltransferase 1
MSHFESNTLLRSGGSTESENRFFISLFTGGGVGDIGFVSAGLELKVANELESDRAALVSHNFPEARIFIGDIWKLKNELVAFIQENNINKPFLLFATPPCQGMSQNGVGSLLRNYRVGKRPKLDPRNRLILPALWIASQIRPKWVVFENVPNMLNTVIMDQNSELRNIMDVIDSSMKPDYVASAKICEFADYGLPQRRKRLITIYTRDETAKKLYSLGYELHPPTTHSAEGGDGKQKWVTVREALKGFASLDAKSSQTARDPKNGLHHVPVLDAKKYEWIKYTAENSSAFDNQCINPDCGYKGNPAHGSQLDSAGINRAKKDTPLYCARCGSLLPRPYVIKNGTKRIMSGYTSAYKRMAWDLPASTLTRNFSFPCSDNKIHPKENRVLSLAEACKLQSISDYSYSWGPIKVGQRSYKIAPDTLIRNVIGESVPPLITHIIGMYLLAMSKGQACLLSQFPEARRTVVLGQFT